MFLFLTLNIFHFFSNVSIVDFEQVNVGWVVKKNLSQVLKDYSHCRPSFAQETFLLNLNKKRF